MFITTFTKVCHLSLFWARSILSVPPHTTSWRSILIWSSHLCLGLHSGLFLSGLPTKTPLAYLLSHMRATCPAHHIFPDLIERIIIGEQYRSFCSSLRGLLQSPVSSSPLSPNIFRSTLFSTFLPECKRPIFTPTQNNRQNYSSVCIDLTWQTGRQKFIIIIIIIMFLKG